MNRSPQEDEERERFNRHKEHEKQRRGGVRQNLWLKATGRVENRSLERILDAERRSCSSLGSPPDPMLSPKPRTGYIVCWAQCKLITEEPCSKSIRAVDTVTAEQ